VIYPGPRRYPLAERVEAVPLGELAGGGGPDIVDGKA
jgi:hypothetical protein